MVFVNFEQHLFIRQYVSYITLSPACSSLTERFSGRHNSRGYTRYILKYTFCLVSLNNESRHVLDQISQTSIDPIYT